MIELKIELNYYCLQNVMQEVIDFLIFRYLHLHLPSVYVKVHIISNTFERNELFMWLVSRFGSNHYVFTP